MELCGVIWRNERGVGLIRVSVTAETAGRSTQKVIIHEC